MTARPAACLARGIETHDLVPGGGAPPAAQFVLANTRLGTPALVPEIRLHLADEVIGFWERAEEMFGPRGETPVPFWAFAWPGGQVLARYLLDHPASVQRRRVLDLASGSGIVAVAAALAGAAEVTASEVDDLAVVAIDLNATANGVTVRTLRGDLLGGPCPEADVVLAGDVFYERPMAERMLPFLAGAAARGAEVLVGDPGRSYLPASGLRPVAEYDVPVDPDLEGAPRRRTTVWKVTDGRPAPRSDR